MKDIFRFLMIIFFVILFGAIIILFIPLILIILIFFIIKAKLTGKKPVGINYTYSTQNSRPERPDTSSFSDDSVVDVECKVVDEVPKQLDN